MVGIVGPANDAKPLDVTKKCLREDQMVASNYSYTDLRLVGIVAQGTHSQLYATSGIYREIHDGGLARPAQVVGQ